MSRQVVEFSGFRSDENSKLYDSAILIADALKNSKSGKDTELPLSFLGVPIKVKFLIDKEKQPEIQATKVKFHLSFYFVKNGIDVKLTQAWADLIAEVIETDEIIKISGVYVNQTQSAETSPVVLKHFLEVVAPLDEMFAQTIANHYGKIVMRVVQTSSAPVLRSLQNRGEFLQVISNDPKEANSEFVKTYLPRK